MHACMHDLRTYISEYTQLESFLLLRSLPTCIHIPIYLICVDMYPYLKLYTYIHTCICIRTLLLYPSIYPSLSHSVSSTYMTCTYIHLLYLPPSHIHLLPIYNTTDTHSVRRVRSVRTETYLETLNNMPMLMNVAKQ